MGRAYAIPTVIDPHAPNRIFLGAAETGLRLERRPHRSRGTLQYNSFSRELTGDRSRSEILRSEDGGKSWRRLNGSLPAGCPHMTCGSAAHPEDANTICVAYTDGSIYASHDAGESWRQLDVSPSKLYGVRLMSAS